MLAPAFSDSITNYQVPEEVHLDQYITATGTFVDDEGQSADTLCSFYFFDANTTLVGGGRASDQYTDGTGRFSMVFFKITEPTFKRDQIYTLQTSCGDTWTDANFTVVQWEGIGHTGEKDFEYVFMDENVGTVVIYFVMFLVIALVLSGGYMLWRASKK